MKMKSLLLLGIVGLAFATIVKTVIEKMDNFDDEEQELEGFDDESGFPLFI
ncbi:hypothetical protein GV828_02210 [Flavobacterium sp. NST-5]|uniref:Uncharacterized protein n=1 Tax=Flavobacterium ichthyis TaxID=2698827 RepID=A0ABW9Z844_9FLAO|nr:hypothetical protein [Flavobacterium ichthyis]NBL64009.1 hypothetical protein [Flavobacterium ichthyis]